MIALLILASATVATAKEHWTNAPAARSRAIAVAYTRCAVAQNRDAVVAYLALPVGTKSDVATVFPSQCLDKVTGYTAIAPSQLKLPAILARGLLFEALYAADYAQQPPKTDVAHAPLQTYSVAGDDPATDILRRDYRALMRIGDCTVRFAPAEARALLAAKPSSKDEEHAAAKLHEVWIDCLPSRHDVTFTIEMLRATMAEPYYKLTRATDQPS